MSFTVEKIATKPIAGQKPGTSGLRKKTKEFMLPNYLENFVQSTFNALAANREEYVFPETLLVGGDGRFYCPEAAKIIVRIAAANGVKRVWVAQNALLSTPNASAVIRNRKGGDESICGGCFILTASHNSGGIDEDFGIKYNGSNGGPAPEKLTNLMFSATTSIAEYAIAAPSMDALWDIGTVGITTLVNADSTNKSPFVVEVFDPVDEYAKMLSEEVFDFDLIGNFLSSRAGDFKLLIDGLSGIGGLSVQRVFKGMLKAGSNVVTENCVPLPDFGGGHPDPNLTYATNLVAKLGLNRDGTPTADAATVKYDMGIAFDGDADRNMILGRQFFVSPSDSVAIIAANADIIPFFKRQGGLKAVARSMPTSGALDFVAKAKGIQLYEVPTGWKFFGNLMDSKVVYHKEDYTPMICGEESFGTGSNHVREKDGLWAALAWLSIIAHYNRDASKPFVSIQQIVEDHWRAYGRSYYCRYDYEGITSEAAKCVMAQVAGLTPSAVPALSEGNPCVQCDSFSYTDPVDGSVTTNQGLRIIFKDQSRFVLRESGTGSSGATLRLYMEQYMPPTEVQAALDKEALMPTATFLKSMVTLALSQSRMAELTGRDAPTVIT